jgi:putative ABC transport system ATP-binding protein
MDGSIELEGVTKTYVLGGGNEVHALADVTLDVPAGQFVVILGPSGSGKTTLLNMIGGLDVPSAGKLVVSGHELGGLDEKALTEYRRSTIGFVFQFFNLIPTLTARENVQLAEDLIPGGPEAEGVLEHVGLADRADHFPNQLSGGEQQRVAIARALVKGAPVMLCDEPTGELDFETGKLILSLLRRLGREQGQTFIVVTHNAPIAAIADRVLRLRSGQIAEDKINKKPLDPEKLVW